MKKHVEQTLFQRLKDFINNRYMIGDGTFSTRDMCYEVNEPSTHSTMWKKWNNNPNYTTHCYLGQLRDLGCVTRIKHGHYKINAPIPNWFGSFHFDGLKGRLEDKSNFYWNSLPYTQKKNPWATIIIDAAKEQDNKLRAKYPANVEGSLEQRIAAMEDELNTQLAKLQDIKNTIIELKALADEQNQVELRYTSQHVNRIFEVTYLGVEYRVIHTYNSDDVYDECWRVKDYRDNDIDSDEIANYLISWVKENCDHCMIA